MKKRNLFWGVFLLLAAVLVVAGQLTGFAQLGFWSILCGIILLAVLVQSIARRSITTALLALALLYIVFQTPLKFYYVQPWLLLLAAVLAGIGLTMIFRPRHRHYKVAGGSWKDVSAPGYVPAVSGEMPETSQGGDDENNPEISISFGASSRYLHAPALQRALIRASFGALEVYFDQATPASGGADIVIDCSFAGIQLYVPRTWRVKDDVSVSLGAIENKNGQAAPGPDAPELRITGSVSLGAVEITYI